MNWSVCQTSQRCFKQKAAGDLEAPSGRLLQKKQLTQVTGGTGYGGYGAKVLLFHVGFSVWDLIRKRLVRWMLKNVRGGRLVETSFHAQSQPATVAMSPLPESARSLGLEQVHKHDPMTRASLGLDLQLTAPNRRIVSGATSHPCCYHWPVFAWIRCCADAAGSLAMSTIRLIPFLALHSYFCIVLLQLKRSLVGLSVHLSYHRKGCDRTIVFGWNSGNPPGKRRRILKRRLKFMSKPW